MPFSDFTNESGRNFPKLSGSWRPRSNCQISPPTSPFSPSPLSSKHMRRRFSVLLPCDQTSHRFLDSQPFFGCHARTAGRETNMSAASYKMTEMIPIPTSSPLIDRNEDIVFELVWVTKRSILSFPVYIQLYCICLSRCSASGARRGERVKLFPVSSPSRPRFFFLREFFSRALLSERLEKAILHWM